MTTKPTPILEEFDAWRFAEGTHDEIDGLLGAHLDDGDCVFRVWAPAAVKVWVMGEFNAWNPTEFPMASSDSGIWAVRVSGVVSGQRYRYRIESVDGQILEKADPVAFAAEEPPATASRVWSLDYDWADEDWMANRGPKNAIDAPISIYELHLGSWRYEPGGYRALARQLVEYLDQTGFTHVELLPVMEHPFYGSWGYQTTSYFAPTARYGEPQDLMFLVDLLHQNGYGVLLDWVPSHFPTDAFALARFDGSYLYEHADPRLGFHPDWKSAIFNYDRGEVRSFLLSSARFWMDTYHLDGLRVDAVASMLYRDYSRNEGEWIPNEFGGNENLGAIKFLQELNRRLYLNYPDALTVAEESTAWPGVSRPTDGGGLGFGYKWDMGWMNDTLDYFGNDPVHRSHHHNALTFRMHYAYSENYVLPLSHDEVVHGKGSLLSRQPGDRWQQFAGLRLLLGYQYAMPGKKLLFMGSELAMEGEWHHEQELPWRLLDFEPHAGVFAWVGELNRLYRNNPALYRLDCEPYGFEWIIGDDDANSVLAFLRKGRDGDPPVLVLANFTPVPRPDYRVGVPSPGQWQELANGDDGTVGGSGIVNGTLATETEPAHGFEQSLLATLPPLAICFFSPIAEGETHLR